VTTIETLSGSAAKLVTVSNELESPSAPAFLEAAAAIGIRTFEDQNGEMQEGAVAQRLATCAFATAGG
jgi:hypothetical protein